MEVPSFSQKYILYLHIRFYRIYTKYIDISKKKNAFSIYLRNWDRRFDSNLSRNLIFNTGITGQWQIGNSKKKTITAR